MTMKHDDGPSPVKTPLERRATTRKKLVIDISDDLHERIIAICGVRGMPVNMAVGDALERAFPKTPQADAIKGMRYPPLGK